MKFIFWLLISLLFIKNSVPGNLCNNKDQKNKNENIIINTPPPILIYLYQSTDPIKNSVGNWLYHNSNWYFENRFSSSHIFPVEKEIDSLETLYENVKNILNFKASKIVFAIDCHGNDHYMCDHTSQQWFDFFNKIKPQTNS